VFLTLLTVHYVFCSFSACAGNIHVAVIEMVSLFPQVVLASLLHFILVSL